MKLHFWLAPLLFSVSLPGWTESTVYRWKDASGQTHFGQTPPTSGNYDVMHGVRVAPTTPSATIPAPPASPGAADGQKSREQKFIEDAEAARKAKAEAKEKERVAKAEKDQRCNAAKERARIAQQGYERVGGDEFTKHFEEAKKEVATHCG